MTVRSSVLSAARAAVPAPLRQRFTISNTNLGGYLIATNRMRYCGARMAANHDGVEFRFDDPETAGPQLERRFKTGTAEPVELRGLIEAQGFLKSEVKRVRMLVKHVDE